MTYFYTIRPWVEDEPLGAARLVGGHAVQADVVEAAGVGVGKGGVETQLAARAPAGGQFNRIKKLPKNCPEMGFLNTPCLFHTTFQPK